MFLFSRNLPRLMNISGRYELGYSSTNGILNYSTSQTKDDSLFADLLEDIKEESPASSDGPTEAATEETLTAGQKLPTKRHRRRMELGPKEASSRSYDCKGSMKKLRIVCDLVKGLNYREAIAQLTLAPQRAAFDVSQCLKSARAHAEHNLGLHPDRLVVAYVTVGRGRTFKAVEYRARARANIRRRRRTNIEVVLREIPKIEGEKRLGRLGRLNPEYKARKQFQPTTNFYDVGEPNFIDVESYTPDQRVQEST